MLPFFDQRSSEIDEGCVAPFSHTDAPRGTDARFHDTCSRSHSNNPRHLFTKSSRKFHEGIASPLFLQRGVTLLVLVTSIGSLFLSIGLPRFGSRKITVLNSASSQSYPDRTQPSDVT